MLSIITHFCLKIDVVSISISLLIENMFQRKHILYPQGVIMLVIEHIGNADRAGGSWLQKCQIIPMHCQGRNRAQRISSSF